MAIRWDKFTVKSQQAIQQAQERATELGNPVADARRWKIDDARVEGVAGIESIANIV